MDNAQRLELNSDGSATLPDWLLDHLNLAPGQGLCVLMEDNRLTVVREDEKDFRGHPYASWRDNSHTLLESS